MSKTKGVKVRQSKGSAPVVVNLTVGSSVTDPYWQEVGLTQAAINEKAIQSFVIDFQGSCRRNWAKFKANPQAYADAYVAGMKASAAVVVTADVIAEQGFTKEQLAWLASQGAQVAAAPAAPKSKK